jgi:hypothetical protein
LSRNGAGGQATIYGKRDQTRVVLIPQSVWLEILELSGAFRKSTLLKLLNQGNYEGAKDEFQRWVYGGGRRLAGLVKRRNHEAELFLPS